MRIRVLVGTAIAGFVLVALAACQDDAVGPDPLDPHAVLYARGAPGPPPGKGGGGGGGGGSGEDFADLLIILRDVNGVPDVLGPYEGEHGVEYCVQPITTEPVPNPYYFLRGELPEYLPTEVSPVDGREITRIPLFAEYDEFMPPEEEEEPGDEEGGKGGKGGKGGGHTSDPTVTVMGPPDGMGPPEGGEDELGAEYCDMLWLTRTVDGVTETYNWGEFAEEVALERLNMVRAPDMTLEQHMEELEILIVGTDPGNVTLDPAGRITFDGTAIDAMPKLQGMREALLEVGTLPGAGAWPWVDEGTPGYPTPFRLWHQGFNRWSTLELSAFALGGAASKFGTLTADAVLYHDRLMGIPPATQWLDTNYSAPLDESFLDYSSFTYDRAETFPGCVTYLDPDDWQSGPIVRTWLEVVDFSEPTPGSGANIAGYAQLTDDVISLILFIHDFDAVIYTADPVGVNTCEAQRNGSGEQSPNAGNPG